MRLDKRLATIQIYYYLPDYNSLIQEFIWQYTDCQPYFPRTHQFLQFWDTDIDAIIKEAILRHSPFYNGGDINNITEVFKLK